MKIQSSKEYSVNKFKVFILLATIVLLNILAVFVVPFFVLNQLYNLIVSWYYIGISLLNVFFICILGVSLHNSYLVAGKEIKRYSKELEYKSLALTHMYNELKSKKANLDMFSEEIEKKFLTKPNPFKIF